jgi:hypothetical protein
MSERRVSEIVIEYEYADPDDFRRVTAIHTMVEYEGGTDVRRFSQVLLMVEYSAPYASQYGPLAQAMP